MEFAGIYMICNLKNNKCYIGQSLRVKERIRAHKYALRHNKHYNIYLQASWNKYGEESFVFSSHCSVLGNTKTTVLENLNEMEKSFIESFSSFKNGYNLTSGGDNYEVSSESREKMSAAHKGKTTGPLSQSARDKLSALHTGMKHSAATREKISSLKRGVPSPRASGYKVGPASEERKRKIGAAQKGELNHNFGKVIPEEVKEKIRASNQGSKCYLAKLTEEKVMIIKKRAADGEKVSTLASEYNVARTQIYSILNKKTWRHVK